MAADGPALRGQEIHRHSEDQIQMHEAGTTMFIKLLCILNPRQNNIQLGDQLCEWGSGTLAPSTVEKNTHIPDTPHTGYHICIKMIFHNMHNACVGMASMRCSVLGIRRHSKYNQVIPWNLYLKIALCDFLYSRLISSKNTKFSLSLRPK